MSNSTTNPIKMNRTWELFEGRMQHVLRTTGNNGDYVLFTRPEDTGKTKRDGRRIFDEVRVVQITRPDGCFEEYEFDTVRHAKVVIASDIKMFA
jgi:hypothetical protein